jgi:hypothetical protein
MLSVKVMVYDLLMQHILHDDDVLFLAEDTIKLIYAIDELAHDYNGPNAHGPPISDVVDRAVEYGADREWVIDTLDRSKYDRTVWSIRNGHITIADHVYDDE